MSLFPLHSLLTGSRQQKAGETQDLHLAGLASVLCLLPKAQGQLEAREVTDYEIVLLLKHIPGPTELRLLGSRGSLRPGRQLLAGLPGSQQVGQGQPVLCVASLLEKGCLGLDSGYLEKEKR